MRLPATGKHFRLPCAAVLSPIALSIVLSIAGTAGAAAPTDQRGFISDGIAGGLLFQRCDAAGPAPSYLMLQDKSPHGVLTAGIGEVRRVMRDADRPLYVEFRGDTAGTTITARQFQRAIGHVDSCATAPPVLPAALRLFAEGAQPAWRLLSSSAGARLEVVGKKPVQFQPVTLTASDAAKKVRSFAAAPFLGGAPMRLEIIEQACNDTSSETAYGARVLAHWGSQRFEGCATRF